MDLAAPGRASWRDTADPAVDFQCGAPCEGAVTPRPASPGLGLRCRCAMCRRSSSIARLLQPPAPDDLVFGTTNRTELDAHNVRRSFRRIATAAGLIAADWTPREMRQSFVSLLSESKVPLEHISRLVGHSGTAVTEAVYRQQLRPVLDEGTTAMDEIFTTTWTRDRHSDSHSIAVRLGQ